MKAETLEKPIVKYNNKWWMLDKKSENGMATLWSNGNPAIVPEAELEYHKPHSIKK